MKKRNEPVNLKNMRGLSILANRTFRLIMICVIILSFFSINIVPSESMEPTLRVYDLVIYKRGQEVKRQDIVLFKNPLDKKEKYVKRVIGIAGDEIQIKSGEVYINSRRLMEPYVKMEWYPEDMMFVVPEGSIFVMGDNRNNSFDSREFGSVQIESVVGKATMRLLPIQRFGNLK